MKSRNIPVLFLATALSLSGPFIVALLGGIIGAELAPSPSLTSLPVALLVVGVAIFVVPASLIMRKIGRKRGFLLAAILGTGGALLGTFALANDNFILFCFSTMLLGMNNAFVQQYRFAAVESVSKAFAGRAVSWVLLGGIMSAFIGPEIAKQTLGIISSNIYGGAFLVLAGLYLLSFFLLLFLENIRSQTSEIVGTGRPLGEIMKQKNFLIAIMAGAISYGSMTFIMTATPIHMNGVGGFGLDHTAFIIQSHVIAMFLPSLFSGILIEKLGLFRVMLSGAVLLLLSTFVGISSIELNQFWIALVLLGLGWNFLFVGATVLLTHSYKENERFKTQAANDFIVFGVRSIASFSAGSVLFFSGWERINLIGFAFVFVAILVLLMQRRGLPKGRATT